MAFINYWLLAYLALGVVSGFLAGLLGIGGGLIMVAVLTVLFDLQGIAPAHVLHLALGTSMATIIFTATASLRAHHRRGAVRWDLVRQMTPGVLLGSVAGTAIAARISTAALALFFACFLLLVALQMALDIRPRPSRQLPGHYGIGMAGAVIGGVSALVAIGGGSLTVPWLCWCNVRVQAAIGTSAALGLPIAVAGTLGYLWNGRYAEVPAGAQGFVFLPALMMLALGSMLTASAGARLAHRLPTGVLKRIFALLLLVLAAKMLRAVWM